MKQNAEKPFLSVMNGEKTKIPPAWLMRQAGRYLPEYRKTRKRAGNFLDLVYNPELAIEVTMQPLRRYNMDAAILFSDILVIPQAMGQKLWFEEGRGPQLKALETAADIEKLCAVKIDEVLAPVYKTVSGLRATMAEENFAQTALIGFAGAPWTIASYMIEGGGSRDFQKARQWAYQDEESFAALIEKIVKATSHYLKKQIDAGAEAIQIFDSWAGVLDSDQFMRWVIAPTKQIVENIRSEYPDIPVIGFPKGAGVLYPVYAKETGVNGLSIDHQLPPEWAAENIPQTVALQGNLDPVCLLAGGKKLDQAADRILTAFGGRAHIFNLGHGIIKETPPEHVSQLLERIRGSAR